MTKTTTPTTTMTMMLMTTLTMMAMTMVAKGQLSQCPPVTKNSEALIKSKLAEIQETNGQNRVTDIYTIDPVFAASGLYKQLCISEDEAAAACRAVNANALIKGRGASAPHPRTCFANLVCAGFMFNPMNPHTTYIYKVRVEVASEGTYFDPKAHSARLWSTINNCAADPCRTHKAVPTGRACNTYVTCEGGHHQSKTCPPRQAFDPFRATCVPDDSCGKPPEHKIVNVGCKATGPPAGRPLTPGVPIAAYYNRTYRNLTTRAEHTVSEMCPASMVFDRQHPKLCKCVPLDQVNCNETLFDVGLNTPHPWSGVIDTTKYAATVVGQGVNKGWLHFQRNLSYSYYEADALKGNELSGDWMLTFTFKLDPYSRNPSQFSLAQNSHHSNACPHPSLHVSVLNSNAVRVQVTVKVASGSPGSSVFSAQVDNVLNRQTSEAVEVRVERQGGTLFLRVKKEHELHYRENSASGLGQRRLSANRCGLVFGQDFDGWVESVRMTRKVCEANS